MELINPEKTYVPIDNTISARINATTEIVSVLNDDTVADAYIEKLNDDILKARLMGESVQLVSDSMTWIAKRIEAEGFVAGLVEDPDLLAIKKQSGMFMGVTEMDINDKRTLMYLVDLGFDDETATSRSVMAPVDESRLLVATKGRTEAELSEIFAENLRILGTIEDPVFIDVLNEFTDAIADADDADSDLMQDIGSLSAQLMAHKSVRGSQSAVIAIGKIVDGIIKRDARYVIAGKAMTIGVNGQKGLLAFQNHMTVASIDRITLIDDYEFDAEGNIVFEETLQPALVVLQDGEEHYFALRHLEEFSKQLNDSGCRSSMQRFMQMYPNAWNR